jgi:16S rRNA (cytosine967-C5)-methyltransferase
MPVPNVPRNSSSRWLVSVSSTPAARRGERPAICWSWQTLNCWHSTSTATARGASQDNLRRLGLVATVRVADCTASEQWWDGQPFDAILADVPCTASGVVRRHPDIKYLRRESDVRRFARLQSALLDKLWPLLRPGGRLLYATCSVFPEENGAQIDAFLVRQPGALRLAEERLLPREEHDGFFYALLRKAL